MSLNETSDCFKKYSVFGPNAGWAQKSKISKVLTHSCTTNRDENQQFLRKRHHRTRHKSIVVCVQTHSRLCSINMGKLHFLRNFRTEAAHQITKQKQTPRITILGDVSDRI